MKSCQDSMKLQQEILAGPIREEMQVGGSVVKLGAIHCLLSLQD